MADNEIRTQKRSSPLCWGKMDGFNSYDSLIRQDEEGRDNRCGKTAGWATGRRHEATTKR